MQAVEKRYDKKEFLKLYKRKICGKSNKKGIRNILDCNWFIRKVDMKFQE